MKLCYTKKADAFSFIRDEKISRSYIEQELGDELLSNGMDKYLYSLTGR